jgi:O-antigen ligase
MSPEPARPRLAAAVHGALIALLIALRPLVWDEDATGVAALGYLVLIVIALTIALGESWAGARRQWRWSAAGLLFAALALAMIPSALRSPLPVQGATLWLTVASQVGLAAYLMQAVPGRERVALAALGAGLFGEAMIAVLQWPWVLPSLAQEQRAGHLVSVAPGEMQGDLAERIANGGLFGTFTLANGLAAYLLLAAPPLAMSALAAAFGWWRRRSEGAGSSFAGIALSAVVAITGLAAALAFLGTKSKGAYLALLAAAVAWWWWRQRKLRRWAPILVIALLAVPVCCSPTLSGLRQGLKASADVRLGYWSAAETLVRERPVAGWGLRSFGEEAPRALPVWAEFSTHAHNEPLELAAEAGLPVALLLCALLAWSARPRVTAYESAPSEQPSRAGPWLLGFGIFYFGVLGLFDSNITWWPGGDDIIAAIGWMLLIAAAMSLVYAVLLRLPPAPGWAYALALGALALHAIIDFDLHSGAVVGTAVICAVLAPGPARVCGSPDRRLPAPALAAATLAVAISLAVAIAACVEGARLRDASVIAASMTKLEMRAFASPDEARKTLSVIAERSGQAEPAEETLARPGVMRDFLFAAFVRAHELSASDYQLRTQLVALVPPGSQREEFSTRLAAQRPLSSAAQGLWAQDERASALVAESASDAVGAARHWHEAIERMRQSCDLAPLMLRLRVAYSELLDEAAQHLPAEAEAMKAEAARQRERIKDLNAKVNPRYRIF